MEPARQESAGREGGAAEKTPRREKIPAEAQTSGDRLECAAAQPAPIAESAAIQPDALPEPPRHASARLTAQERSAPWQEISVPFAAEPPAAHAPLETPAAEVSDPAGPSERRALERGEQSKPPPARRAVQAAAARWSAERNGDARGRDHPRPAAAVPERRPEPPEVRVTVEIGAIELVDEAAAAAAGATAPAPRVSLDDYLRARSGA
jgi:hypothetical protein